MKTLTVKQTGVVITILVAVSLSGCTKTALMPGSEIRIAPPAVVTTVKLDSGEQITFDQAGGRFHQAAAAIQGKSTDGTRQTVRISDIDSVYFTVATDSSTHCQSANDFKEQQKRANRDTVKGRIKAASTSDTYIEFDGSYGRIDTLNYALVGNAKSGEPVQLPLKSVTSVKVRRIDGLKTGLLLGGIAVLIYSIATFEMDLWEEDEQIF
ncbi:MAG: hypothetical protein JSV52_06665 [Candidatus Zixiibacteriota bacterium]|nr:MAG: hypothetical protein JSV52_06665 [candidate division Zixibacteria bacterium]